MIETKSLICNCSLAGTSACKDCSNYKSVFGDESVVTTYSDKTYTLEPYTQEKSFKPVLQYWCPKCDALVGKYSNYCHNCGVKLDWSEEE